MSASIAAVRGYDLTSEEVQSAVLISLLGAGAAGVVGKVGVEIGTKSAMAGLKKCSTTCLKSLRLTNNPRARTY